MNGFTVKPHHPSAQVQSAIVVEEHAFRHAEDRFPLKFQLLDIFPALDKAFFIFHAVFGAVILYDLFEIGVLR